MPVFYIADMKPFVKLVLPDTLYPCFSCFIERNLEYFHGRLLVGDVGTFDIDWDKYNMLNTQEANNIKFCHPSAYGHRKIAEYIADLLCRENAWSCVVGRDPCQ